jgi:hypothetical protein
MGTNRSIGVYFYSNDWNIPIKSENKALKDQIKTT